MGVSAQLFLFFSSGRTSGESPPLRTLHDALRRRNKNEGRVEPARIVAWGQQKTGGTAARQTNRFSAKRTIERIAPSSRPVKTDEEEVNGTTVPKRN